jgi:hypothetical protein
MKITKKLLIEMIEQETRQILKEEWSEGTSTNKTIPFTLHHQQYLSALWQELGDPNTGRDATQDKILKLQKRIKYLERLVRKHEKQPHVTDTTSSSKT